MKDEITCMLEEKIKSGIESLDNYQDGTQDKAAAIDDLTTLYKLRIEEAKLEESRLAAQNALIVSEREEQSKKAQMIQDRILQGVKLGLEGISIVGGLVLYATYLSRGFKFEETGSYTSKTFLNLIGRIKSPK